MASVVDLKSKEEKDAELDRKIEALRKKNEALVKRHQLIEEDRKRAEQEGMAVTTPRKVKIPDGEPDKARKEKENFSITLDVSPGEKRTVSDSKSPRGSHTPTRTETSPKSPTQRTSGRTGARAGGRSPHFDRPGDPLKIDGDYTHTPERPARGRRSQGAEGPRGSPWVAKEGPPVDKWAAIPRGGGGAPRGRGEGTPGRGEGGRGEGTPGRGEGGRGEGTPGRGEGGRGEGTPGRGEGGRGEGTPGRGEGTPGRGEGGRGEGTPGRGEGTPGRGGGHGGNLEGTDRKVKEWEEKRKQNIEKMNEEMEKIAEYERSQRDGVRDINPIRNFLDDPRRTGPIVEVDRKEGSRRHIRNWGGPDFEKVKTGMDREKESHVRRPQGRNQMDMTLSMTGRERAEYMRWKQERERIDQERLERHRKPTGQWKREWDAEKTDTMFKEGSTPPIEEDEPMGRRDQGKKGAPKPPTMAEFLPRNLQSSGQKRDQNRGRGRNKPYSMHDSRWEEDEEEEADEKEKTLPVEDKEKETCVEKTEEKKVEGQQKSTSIGHNLRMDENNDELKHDKEEEEFEEGDEEEWTDASGDEDDDEVDEDGSEVEEDSIEEAAKASPAPPKEQRLPQQMETPKLTMPPANVNTNEEAVESKPSSPFSPEGYRPVTDWGEEMEQLSPPGSSNEDSPPQAVNRKVISVDSRSHSDSAQNSSLDPEGAVASCVESSSLQSPEVHTDQKQKPVEESPGGELLPGAPTLPLERDPDSSINHGERLEEISAVPAETSLAVEETSQVQEQSSPATEEALPVKEEPTPLAEDLEGTVKAVHIADFETQSTEIPQSS
ncbi:coiled-coil domain-containing protein 9 isoform X3 [Rana temporaria]|uniref:coiled-coil domain-containing protein 9 isoform X3 n=1 Tax=Rana temporaria TaxID=8407 RepID=UPI001AACC9FA|nr:coiled-coil domain-containing protein 9 isoform X3 [Rana temporaria]